MAASSKQPSSPSITCDQALKIAQTDPARAYGELLGYRTTVVLEGDGWHIDYELLKPLTAGGGAHYVIDALTGAILSKKYEQ
jgi:hypothetical protein